MSRRQYKKPPSNASHAQEAFRKYAEDAADQGKHVENALANSFSAMEGSLVEFVKTGKLNSKSLADSEASSAVAAARLAYEWLGLRALRRPQAVLHKGEESRRETAQMLATTGGA